MARQKKNDEEEHTVVLIRIAAAIFKYRKLLATVFSIVTGSIAIVFGLTSGFFLQCITYVKGLKPDTQIVFLIVLMVLGCLFFGMLMYLGNKAIKASVEKEKIRQTSIEKMAVEETKRQQQQAAMDILKLESERILVEDLHIMVEVIRSSGDKDKPPQKKRSLNIIPIDRKSSR